MDASIGELSGNGRHAPNGGSPAALELAGRASPVDRQAAERAVADLLRALGADPARDELRETPRRVAAAFVEMFAPVPFTLTTFPNDEAYDELVMVRDVPFHSLCEHHLLPFVGVAHVGYIPGRELVGLSKLARVVDHCARGLQVQERMTTKIASYLDGRLRPKGVGVVLEAEHLCMSIRGVSKPGTRTVTSTLMGAVREDGTRQEFLALAGIRSAAS